jgi:hypothetical protein
MQRRTETVFIQQKAEMLARILSRGGRPQTIQRPARPSTLYRALMRLVPRLARRWQLAALRQCGLFDAAWYLATYDDVRTAGVDPALHYLLHGPSEGRDPSPHFVTRHYLKLHPDVRKARINPVIHYLTAGWDERRSIHPDMPEGQA